MNNNSEIIMYTNDDGDVKIEVKMEDETVWLTQMQMVELFQSSKANVSEHIKHIFEEGELEEKATVRKFRTVQKEGNREVARTIVYYNLDVIISVGYRVKSLMGTKFRIWATKLIKEYLKKGFAMDDERLKNLGSGKYFEELLQRIRDIRSSEKVFWRKVLEIYATSIDYDPKTEESEKFFKTVQNKMHFATHGNTAAEIIFTRANSEKDFMGLTNWTGILPTKNDVQIAKNYLREEEIDVLNRIVMMYLEFAELRALERKPMYMKDWIEKLDDFLKTSDKEILINLGEVSHDRAMKKAFNEYEKYKKRCELGLSPVERHFIESIDKMKKIEERK